MAKPNDKEIQIATLVPCAEAKGAKYGRLNKTKPTIKVPTVPVMIRTAERDRARETHIRKYK
jgi:hypothetical protein